MQMEESELTYESASLQFDLQPTFLEDGPPGPPRHPNGMPIA